MQSRWLIPAVILTLIALFLFHLGSTGFLGPDEPRYASIGRAMAQSGDWITPRLDGQPWFEKPPLAYWLTALGNLLHLRDEWAARLPQFLISIVFLVVFYGIVAKEFSLRVATLAVCILATSVGWLAYSYVALTDLPMAVTLNLAIFSTLFDTRDTRHDWNPGWLAGVFLGLSILAKGLVPLVLFAPLFLIARGKRLATFAAMILVAAPWYIACFWRNGHAFWDDFFWKQHVARFLSPTLEHVQPFWFYVPVLLGGLFPWSPLVGLLGDRKLYDDLRVRTLTGLLLYGFLFFSISRNKLPGYLLPLLPSLAIVLAAALNRSRNAGYWLAACGALLAILPTAGKILPGALRAGLSRTPVQFEAGGFVLAAVAALAWWLCSQQRLEWAAGSVALATGLGIVYLMFTAMPVLDREVSVRRFYRESSAEIAGACLAGVNRAFEYGLNYYAKRALSPCDSAPGKPRIQLVDGRFKVLDH